MWLVLIAWISCHMANLPTTAHVPYGLDLLLNSPDWSSFITKVVIYLVTFQS